MNQVVYGFGHLTKTYRINNKLETKKPYNLYLNTQHQICLSPLPHALLYALCSLLKFFTPHILFTFYPLALVIFSSFLPNYAFPPGQRRAPLWLPARLRPVGDYWTMPRRVGPADRRGWRPISIASLFSLFTIQVFQALFRDKEQTLIHYSRFDPKILLSHVTLGKSIMGYNKILDRNTVVNPDSTSRN